MIIDKKINKNDDKSIGYIDVIFESSNILKTTYFPQKEKLYIHFKRGGTYSYGGITEEIYNNFETTDSQGKFLAKEIKPNATKHPYSKEYTLNQFEIDEINEIIKNHKSKLNG